MPEKEESKKNIVGIKIYQAPFILFLKIILLMLIIGIADIVAMMIIDFTSLETSTPDAVFSYEAVFFLLSMGLQILLTCYLFLKWSFEYFYLTERELIEKKGILFKKAHSFDLRQLDSVSFFQSLIGRFFSYGTVTLFFANQKFDLHRFPNPAYFTSILNTYKSK